MIRINLQAWEGITRLYNYTVRDPAQLIRTAINYCETSGSGTAGMTRTDKLSCYKLKVPLQSPGIMMSTTFSRISKLKMIAQI